MSTTPGISFVSASTLPITYGDLVARLERVDSPHVFTIRDPDNQLVETMFGDVDEFDRSVVDMRRFEAKALAVKFSDEKQKDEWPVELRVDKAKYKEEERGATSRRYTSDNQAMVVTVKRLSVDATAAAKQITTKLDELFARHPKWRRYFVPEYVGATRSSSLVYIHDVQTATYLQHCFDTELEQPRNWKFVFRALLTLMNILEQFHTASYGLAADSDDKELVALVYRRRRMGPKRTPIDLIDVGVHLLFPSMMVATADPATAEGMHVKLVMGRINRLIACECPTSQALADEFRQENIDRLGWSWLGLRTFLTRMYDGSHGVEQDTQNQPMTNKCGWMETLRLMTVKLRSGIDEMQGFE